MTRVQRFIVTRLVLLVVLTALLISLLPAMTEMSTPAIAFLIGIPVGIFGYSCKPLVLAYLFRRKLPMTWNFAFLAVALGYRPSVGMTKDQLWREVRGSVLVGKGVTGFDSAVLKIESR